MGKLTVLNMFTNHLVNERKFRDGGLLSSALEQTAIQKKILENRKSLYGLAVIHLGHFVFVGRFLAMSNHYANVR